MPFYKPLLCEFGSTHVTTTAARVAGWRSGSSAPRRYAPTFPCSPGSRAPWGRWRGSRAANPWPWQRSRSWQSPQAFRGLLTEGVDRSPVWAAALSMLAGLPPWQLSQATSPCSVDRNSLETRTFSCGSNGATEPPQPAPDCIADFLALTALRFFRSIASSR